MATRRTPAQIALDNAKEAMAKKARDAAKALRLKAEEKVRKKMEKEANTALVFPRRPGRPSTYTKALGAEICARLSTGESLIHITKDDHMPDQAQIYKWVNEDREGFYENYTRARECMLDAMLEDLNRIPDETSVELDVDGKKVIRQLDSDVIARNRLRVETKKWYLSKIAPKRFGDRVETVHSGSLEVTQPIDQVKTELAKLLGK